jgi:outer membrane protein OmpA-like peptidoglycan-associated protein
LFPATVWSKDISVKKFDPIASPFGILTVHGSRSMGHLKWDLRLTTNYADDLLVGRVQRDVRFRVVGNRLSSELSAGLGIGEWLDVMMSLPVYWWQTSENFPNKGDSTSALGFGDLRLAAKARILDNRKYAGFGLAFVLEASLFTGRANAFMRDPSLTLTPKLVADFRLKNGFVVALNTGFRIQGQDSINNYVSSPEFRVALGTEVPVFFQGMSLIGELNFAVGVGATTPQGIPADKVTAGNPLELLVGVRWRHVSGFGLTLGSGGGLTGSAGAPDFRVFLSLGYFSGKQPNAAGGDKPVQRQASRRPPPPDNSRPLPPPTRSTPQVATSPKPPPFRKVKKVSTTAFVDRSQDQDPDGDGLPNHLDQCPQKPEDFDNFQDSDGCPDLDNDRDGIPDVKDKCPLKPETINGIKDEDGCPDKGLGKVLLSKGRIVIKQRIFFKSGSDKLKAKSAKLLKEVAAFLKAYWQVRKVRIEGHTDSLGDKEMNVDLSERRARRVMSFLISEGVAEARLQAKGYGLTRPVASNKTYSGRAKNRRVEFIVVKVLKTPAKGGAR